MIPKIIHYCWFGEKPKNQQIIENINKWRIIYPDYRIIEWNETNFNINKYEFTKQAYFAKKYAFVSDVARLSALVEYGGFYFDTDIIACKPFDDKILKSIAVLGFEQERYISTAFMACEKGHPFFKDFLKTYYSQKFLGINFLFKCKHFFNLTPNVKTLTKILINRGLKNNNTFQVIDGIDIYPQIYFSAKNVVNGMLLSTNETYVIHNFANSWGNKKKNKISSLMNCIKELRTVLKYYAMIIKNRSQNEDNNIKNDDLE